MEDSAGTSFYHPRYYVGPFIINSDEGKLLVLKAIKLFNVRTIDCSRQELACSEKSISPTTPTEKCFSPSSGPRVRFMNSETLSNIFATSTDRAARTLNEK